MKCDSGGNGVVSEIINGVCVDPLMSVLAVRVT